ncbi:MAG: polysaccharide export outer membrane protein [Roseivirga sp.]
MEADSYDVSPAAAIYKIRNNDILNITVKSLNINGPGFADTESVQNVQPAQSGTGNPQLLFSGYSLDEFGEIDVPLIGTIAVLGLSLKEIETIIAEKLKPHEKFTNVTVHLSNFRVTLMGEVENPGVQYIYERDYNLLQAIANAGDLTDFANRQKVRLLRKEGEKIKSIWLDLTNPALVSSEYFQLHQGDHIYIEPLKAKFSRENTKNLSIGVSVISLLVTLLALFSR